jgi:hypothetical protein
LVKASTDLKERDSTSCWKKWQSHFREENVREEMLLLLFLENAICCIGIENTTIFFQLFHNRDFCSFYLYPPSPSPLYFVLQPHIPMPTLCQDQCQTHSRKSMELRR